MHPKQHDLAHLSALAKMHLRPIRRLRKEGALCLSEVITSTAWTSLESELLLSPADFLSLSPPAQSPSCSSTRAHALREDLVGGGQRCSCRPRLVFPEVDEAEASAAAGRLLLARAEAEAAKGRDRRRFGGSNTRRLSPNLSGVVELCESVGRPPGFTGTNSDLRALRPSPKLRPCPSCFSRSHALPCQPLAACFLQIRLLA